MDPGSSENGLRVQCEIQGVPLNCKKNLFFTVRVIRHCNRLSSEVLKSPSLKVYSEPN